MRRVIAASGAALAIALVAAPAAQACSCVPPDPKAMLREADGAFIGRLMAVRAVDPLRRGRVRLQRGPTDYIYRVGRVYNGGPGLRRGRRVRVRSVRDGATCGLPRGRGRLYGLFLTRAGGLWHSNLCSVVTPAEMRRAAASGRPEVRGRVDARTCGASRSRLATGVASRRRCSAWTRLGRSR